MCKAPLLSLAVLTVLVAAPATAQNAKVTKDIEGVANFARIETTIACGGATKPEAIAEIGKLGFVSVINLRLPDEPGAGIQTEAAAAKKAGMRFTNIPFSTQMPDPAAVDRFLTTIQLPGAEPAFIHCAGGSRAAMMWLVKRVLVDHWDIDRATKEATDLGLASEPLKKFAIEYINTHKR
jgi:uncharacterized protein (TIGR01244 family)